MKPNPETSRLHPRNPHRSGYDFSHLCKVFPALAAFVVPNRYQPDTQTIDFSDPDAVKALNAALLLAVYNIRNWDIPAGYLCPPIPGRADYIHCLADLLADSNAGQIPTGSAVCALDIGTGANCVYPLLGQAAYGWQFVATDIDAKALRNCAAILQSNPTLGAAISLQQQMQPRFIFKDIIAGNDRFAFTMCNPPFHASKAEAEKGSLRKANNLQTDTNALRNFGGMHNELWCIGGELGFITQMIYESAKYPGQVLWFTTLVSKKANLSALHKTLQKVNASQVNTIEMGQGQKTSRILAWTFWPESERKCWKF